MKQAQSKSATRALARHRREIDRADQQLLVALARRFRAIEKVAIAKAQLGLPARQNSRWAAVVRERLQQGEKLGLDPTLIKKLFSTIHGQSLRIQLLRAAGKSAKPKSPP